MLTIKESTSVDADTVQQLVAALARTAAERDRRGDTPKAERDMVRDSGLLRLSIPKEFGGRGAPWPEILWVVREIAKVDSSLAHVFGYHFLQLSTPHFYGTSAQRTHYYKETAAKNWFWGNAINSKDRRVKVTRDGEGYVLNGTKYFCSGAKDADMLVVSAYFEGEEKPNIFVIPAHRPGIVFDDDWNGLGQRQTDSGSVHFQQVRVWSWEHLNDPGPNGTPFSTLRSVLTQLILSHVLVGIAKGALETAKTGAVQRLMHLADDAGVVADVLRLGGEMWVQCQAAEQLAVHAAEVFQQAWERQFDLTHGERGKAAVAVFTAKVAAVRAALDVTSRIFDVMGARSAVETHRNDRFWRNARTLSLHDPVDTKLRELGTYALHGVCPVPGFYS
ncbi:MAG: acyl-CoA dehydrogenase family protein [Bacillota bacterium]